MQNNIVEGLAVQKQDLGSGTWSTAKSMCEASRVGGFSDWRLPTIAELAMMYTHRNEIGGFESAKYWSSTKNSYGDAYYYDYNGGYQSYNSNFDQHYVRAVRTVK